MIVSVFLNLLSLSLSLNRVGTDCAIFLEFKHYKPKKHKNSVRCFCILEKDELKNGSFPLEMCVTQRGEGEGVGGGYNDWVTGLADTKSGHSRLANT